MAYQARNLNTNQTESRATPEVISIVIATLGRPILEYCLYLTAVGSKWPKDLIVVDQSSSQQVRAWTERLQFPGIDAEHVPSRQQGRAAGVKRGLEQVKTRSVAVTDGDWFVDRDWSKNMVVQMRMHPEAMVTGRTKTASDDGVNLSQ